MIFKSDPQAALGKTQRKLADVEANIADMATKGAEVLLSAEDASAVVALDKAIEAEQANAAIYQDRIRALEEECRKALFHQREGERAKSIERVKRKLAKREALALELQTVIARVGHLYAQLITPDEAEIDWPFPRPGHGFAALDRRGVDREVGWLLHGLNKEHRVPEGNSIGLGVIGVTAQGIDGVVRIQNESIISRLEMVPIADDLLEESA